MNKTSSFKFRDTIDDTARACVFDPVHWLLGNVCACSTGEILSWESIHLVSSSATVDLRKTWGAVT